MAKRRSSNASVLDIPVEFGGVSIGDKTARLGVHIARDQMTLKQAADMLVGRRLTGKIVARPHDESTEQQRLDGFECEEIESTFDVKKLGINNEHYDTGLTFSRKDVDMGDLSTFAKKAGRLVIEDVAELENGDGKDEHDEDEGGGE